MQLSLSVRIAEGFLSKEEPVLSLEEVAGIATSAGYDAVCMRASQVGIQSTSQQVDAAANVLQSHSLPVTMVTGDFDIVYNNQRGPDCLRDIAPFLELATKLKAPLIRVALKKPADIEFAKAAADKAAEHNLTLVHQCHTLSLFETVAGMRKTLQAIDRDNFRLIYEPANLEICGQDYGRDTIEQLAPWIVNVYLQNQILKANGEITLNTWAQGEVSFDLIGIHEPGGIDFASIFDALRSINYAGPVTAHQSPPQGTPPAETARKTADFLHSLSGK